MIPKTNKRFDIQFLRGFAVLAVIVFHAAKEVLPKGYLGVDIFFVISGFLITGSILQQLKAGTFSFKKFYLRRAKRLLPASLVTLSLTTLLSLFLLSPVDFESYSKQLVGSLTFTANFFLAQQTDYFAGKAETKPLLHIWSLSLEEQFYFIAPLLLWLTPIRRHFLLLFFTTALSILLCLILVNGVAPASLGVAAKTQTKLAFFMLPTRAWELLVGSFAAFVMLKYASLKVSLLTKYISLISIVLVSIFGISDLHPGPDAIVVTFATSLLLLGHHQWLHFNLLTRSFAKIGDWSYSLYLLHWPLFSFAFIIFLGNPPLWLIVVLGFFAIFLGWLQYRFIEQPILNGRFSMHPFSWILIVGITILLGISAFIIKNNSMVDPDLELAKGLDTSCDQRGNYYSNLPKCQLGLNPTFMLWGDSYAMHLVPGIRSTMGDDLSFVQATKSACAPILAISHVDVGYSKAWADNCINFNKSVVESLISMPMIKYVVLASPWAQILKDGGQDLYRNGKNEEWSPIGRQHLINTIKDIEKLGKKVILIGPTAIAQHDVGACNARALFGRFYVRDGGCDPTVAEVNNKIGSVILELQSVTEQTGALLLLPTEVMCQDGQRCLSVINGKSIYRDTGHLTFHGSIFLVESLELPQIIKEDNF